MNNSQSDLMKKIFNNDRVSDRLHNENLDLEEKLIREDFEDLQFIKISEMIKVYSLFKLRYH